MADGMNGYLKNGKAIVRKEMFAIASTEKRLRNDWPRLCSGAGREGNGNNY